MSMDLSLIIIFHQRAASDSPDEVSAATYLKVDTKDFFAFTKLLCNHPAILDLPVQNMKEAENHNVGW